MSAARSAAEPMSHWKISQPVSACRLSAASLRPAVGADHAVGLRELRRDGAADATAGAGHNASGFGQGRLSIPFEISSNVNVSMNGVPLTNTVGVLATPRATPS